MSSELMAYSGFSASNYLYAPYSSNLDFGTGDFHISCWAKFVANGGDNPIIDRQDAGAVGNRLRLYQSGAASKVALQNGGSIISSNFTYTTGIWHKIDAIRLSGLLYLYINGVVDSATPVASSVNITNTSASLFVGVNYVISSVFPGSIALLHISAGAPSAAQIKAAYEAERPLFQANAKCLLAGTSNDVKAVDYDRDTGIHHAITGDYYNAFKGLQRVDSASGVWTSISAKNGLVVKGA